MHQTYKRFILTAALALMGMPALTLAAQANLQSSSKAVLDEAWQIVNREYVDPQFNQVDWQSVRQTLLSQEYASREAAYEALRQELSLLNDPYTRFMSPEEFQSFRNRTNGELVGVGIQLRADPSTQALTVVQPIENSPAAAAGIQPGDVLQRIDGQSTEGMMVEDAVRLIRGEAGSPVWLTMRRGESTRSVRLTRSRIQLQTVTSAVHTTGGQRIGYIRLRDFNAHAAEEMERAIQSLQAQQVDGFVLDLRNNPGGRLNQSIAIARMWLNDGDIVRTVNRHDRENRVQADQTALTNLPLAVLVNGNSASASEVLAGALQDNQRAVIVGTQTFGKALVQSVNTLSDGSGLNVTIARYYTPSGLDINRRGIAPDRIVPIAEDQSQALSSDQWGTTEDPQFVQAISALSPAIASPEQQPTVHRQTAPNRRATRSPRRLVL
ncbi:S41 family peptidase [Egbenema bharatensis]|uniref:S41 family peptidase n=1 Tax=Egbenema bharatensis TaxID=3463334 RepID=UPI003A85889D